MAKAIDLTGQTFNYLQVIKRDYEKQKEHINERQAWWKCKCLACGKILSMRSSVIRKSTSCGCVRKKQKVRSDKQISAYKRFSEQKRMDLTGQRFSRLLVLEYADDEHQVYYNKKHKATWKCQCDCGNICYVTAENLRRGDTPSCGCITKEHRRAQLKDLSGQRFGHLLVLEWLGTINRNSRYKVRCDCGKEYELYAQNLTQGTTTSCGCVKESHGEAKIRDLLTQNKIKFVSQKTFNDFVLPSQVKPRYDFFLPDYNILIEYDGEQHFKSVPNWGGEKGLQQRQDRDNLKNIYALENNFVLIRIPYTHYNEITIEDLLLKSKYRLEK